MKALNADDSLGEERAAPEEASGINEMSCFLMWMSF